MTESHLRSILKGISWRIVGTVNTMLLSYLVTNSLATALKISVTEVVTKLLLYYMHERSWIKYLKERNQNAGISLFKSISWRALATLDTIILTWFYSANPYTALKLGAAEVFTKIPLYYIHERLWHQLPLGTVRRWFGITASEDDYNTSATTNTLPDTNTASPAEALDKAAL